MHIVDADGKVTSQRDLTPIAADTRPEGDGEELARLKLIAGLLGLELDVIVRRDMQEQRRRRRVLTAVAAGMLALAVAAFGSAYWAVHVSKQHEQLVGLTLQRASSLVETSVKSARERGVPIQESILFLDQASLLFDDIKKYGENSSEIQYQTAKLLMSFADSYENLGKPSTQLEYAQKALGQLKQISEAPASLPQHRLALAEATWRVGKAYSANGKYQTASSEFKKCLDEINKDNVINTEDKEFVLLNAKCRSSDSLDLMLLGKSDDAIQNLSEVISFLHLYLKKHPDIFPVQQLLCNAYMAVAELLRQKHDTDNALEASALGLALIEKLRQSSNQLSIRRLAGSLHVVRGDSFTLLKQYAATIREFQAALNIFDELATADPTSVSIRTEMSFAHLKIGEALQNMGEVDKALVEFEKSEQIIYKDVVGNPSSAALHQVTSYALQDQGYALLKLKQYDRAKAAFQRRLEIALKMYETDNKSQMAQRSIAEARIGLGEIYLQQDNAANAYTQFLLAIEIRRSLVEASSNPSSQRLLADALMKLAAAEIAMGGNQRAIKLLNEAKDIREKLISNSQDKTQNRRRDAFEAYRMLGETSLNVGDCMGAVAVYKNGVDLLKGGSSGPSEDTELSNYLKTQTSRLSEIEASCASRSVVPSNSR